MLNTIQFNWALIAVTYLLSLHPIASANAEPRLDNMRCRNFLRSQNFIAGPASWYFRLAADGSIRPTPNVKHAKDGDTETLAVEKSWYPAHTLVIRHQANGGLASIEVQTPLTAEIVNGSDSDIDSIDNESGIPIKKTWIFETRNGQCMPTEERTQLLMERKTNGAQKNIITASTQLCHDLINYFAKHPEMRACTNDTLRSELKDIFTKDLKEEAETFPLGFGIRGASGTVAKNSAPFLRAGIELALCKSKGLLPFARNTFFWPKASPITQLQKSEKTGATGAQ